MKMKPCSVIEPWNDVIGTFLAAEFPFQVDSTTTMEVVVGQLFGTKDHRPGPLPVPEHQVRIRRVAQYYIDRQQPLPVLVPWGSRKPDNSGVDVAEFMALRMLECLHDRVARVYAPSVRFVMRVEDTSGYWLFHDEAGVAEGTAKYTQALNALIGVLGLRPLITYKAESQYLDAAEFAERASRALAPMSAYLDSGLLGDGPAYNDLLELGWRGIIPQVQRDYYLARYGSFYPGSTVAYRTAKLARYFAGSLARHQLGVGAEKEWGTEYLQLNFASDPPGVPVGLAHNRLYYRTMPAAMSRTHIPPWRARGILSIRGRDVVPKVRYWPLDPELRQAEYELTGHGHTVQLNTPLLIES